MVGNACCRESNDATTATATRCQICGRCSTPRMVQRIVLVAGRGGRVETAKKVMVFFQLALMSQVLVFAIRLTHDQTWLGMGD